MSNPDHVILAAGGLSLAGGYAREGRFPANGVGSIVGTMGLVIIAASLKNTKVAPLVNAFAWLFLLVAVYASVPGLHSSFTASVKKGKKNGR